MKSLLELVEKRFVDDSREDREYSDRVLFVMSSWVGPNPPDIKIKLTFWFKQFSSSLNINFLESGMMSDLFKTILYFCNFSFIHCEFVSIVNPFKSSSPIAIIDADIIYMQSATSL